MYLTQSFLAVNFANCRYINDWRNFLSEYVEFVVNEVFIMSKSKGDENLSYSEFLEESKKYFYQNFFLNSNKHTVGIADFELICKLGSGAFGNVVLSRYTPKNTYHAIKILKKAHIIKSKQLEHTKNEKRILLICKHPNLMKMDYFAIDKANLYFILPFLNGGDLYVTFNRMRRFEEKVTKFFAAQVFLGLEYLHYLNIVYRDLKPENIMLDNTGYAKITDFGFCKVLSKGRTYTICGTPEYIAPELVIMKGYSHTADWWSFGILLFELTAGVVPFKDNGDHVRLYNSIVLGKFKMPSTFSKELKDLINRLLQVDTTKRIGCLRRGSADIKEHDWFADVPWVHIFNKKVVPPVKPVVKDPNEKEAENMKLSAEPETDRFEKEFQDF
ncbi:cAMP-dependent protein kinase catalytic subunit 1-like [Atheta coriaria]|uniref:cAMP-dependent protein kinase catalytic subunit 1-like n=1 Tax=Dalotia coriaria TaxID=877792 RepID=UPI0031F3426A